MKKDPQLLFLHLQLLHHIINFSIFILQTSLLRLSLMFKYQFPSVLLSIFTLYPIHWLATDRQLAREVKGLGWAVRFQTLMQDLEWHLFIRGHCPHPMVTFIHYKFTLSKTC